MMQLARVIGGKASFILRGELMSIELRPPRATEAAGGGLLESAEIIARPHTALQGTAL
jgi:microcompartment protein CcmL/EutN